MMKNLEIFDKSILDKNSDAKHSLILGKPKSNVTKEIIEISKNIVVNRYRGKFFPIRLLQNIKIKEYVVNNTASKPINLPISINEDLCKIWGALAADGHITTKSKPDYIIQITDGDFSAIKSFQRWFENCFALKPKIHKYKNINAWRICVSNKIIGRYIVEFLGFPTNKKSSTVNVPHFLDNNQKIKSFLIGVFTFDAGVNLNGNIEYLIKNEGFFKSIVFLLTKLNLRFKHSGKPDKNNQWRFHTYKLNKSDLSKWLWLFEKDSEKHHKIIDLIEGYTKIPESESDVILSFEKTFPMKNASVVSLKDIFFYIKEKKTTNIGEISETFSVKKETTIKYRTVLKKFNIIKEKRIIHGKSRIKIIFNDNISSWKIPWRKHYDS